MLLHDLVLGPRPDTSSHSDALLMRNGSWTRAELRAAVEDMVDPLSTLAPVKGRIAVAADNRPEVIALLLAIPASGRVAVPLDLRMAPDEMASQVDAVGATAVIGTEETLARLAPVLVHVPAVQACVGLDAGAGDITLTALVAAPAPAAPQIVDRDAPAWLLFTRHLPSSKRPIVLTVRSLAEAIANLGQAHPLDDDDVYLHPFPPDHVSITHLLHTLHRGRPVVLPRRFDPAEVIDLAHHHGVTTLSLAPTMLRALLDRQKGADDPSSVLSGLRRITCTAAATPALVAEAQAALGAELIAVDRSPQASQPGAFLPFGE